MLLAHGEDNCRPVVTISRLCQSKFSLVEFLGTSLNRIWFKHSVLLEIFELNGREAKMPFKPYRKVIFTSFSNKKSKFETCSQLVLKTSATAEVDLGTIRWFLIFPISCRYISHFCYLNHAQTRFSNLKSQILFKENHLCIPIYHLTCAQMT